jgi:hypothetical protein
MEEKVETGSMPVNSADSKLACDGSGAVLRRWFAVTRMALDGSHSQWLAVVGVSVSCQWWGI